MVIETPDDRVLLYDAGTTTGPDAVRRVIAPYLWSRGISSIDEVFISHADLDHFNGVPELLKRFPVGRVTLTPTFSDKSSPGVEAVLASLARHGVATRIAVSGDRFEAGDVTFDVLHPPAERLEGNENTRSMVLFVRFGSHSVLLTGDLEGAGQRAVQERPLRPVDVMLAPHHGAKTAHTPLPATMATWANPKFVISSQRPGPTEHLMKSYPHATVWDTPTAGAVTVRCHSTGVITESFRMGELLVIKRGN
ncbi:MAG: MBL fold metallo-hydrolase [Gemmataceae bacterium]